MNLIKQLLLLHLSFLLRIKRKRSVANILKDNLSSSNPNPSFTEDVKITIRTPRSKIQCLCGKCNEKLVDSRTKRVHEMRANETSTSSPINILPTETPMT